MLTRICSCLVLLAIAGGCAKSPKGTAGVQFLKFYADWCGPCKLQKPIVDDLEKEFSGISFRHINVDEERDLAQQYKINSIPCMVIVVEGQEKKRFVGVQSRETLSAELSRYKGTTSASR